MAQDDDGLAQAFVCLWRKNLNGTLITPGVTDNCFNGLGQTQLILDIKNGLNIIPSYNDATNAGRIYIGFPVINKNNAAVFAADLGFNGIIDGSALPCFF